MTFLSSLIIVSTLISLFIIHNKKEQKRFEKKYDDFLFEMNGKNFFCYNNRKNSNIYIEQNIIPELNQQIEILYLDGKELKSEYPKEFISRALYRLKNYKRFPHLVKIRDEKLIDMSVNNVFFNMLNYNYPKVEFLNQINRFFELS